MSLFILCSSYLRIPRFGYLPAWCTSLQLGEGAQIRTGSQENRDDKYAVAPSSLAWGSVHCVQKDAREWWYVLAIMKYVRVA